MQLCSAQSAAAAGGAKTDGAASGMDSQAGAEGAIAPGASGFRLYLEFQGDLSSRVLPCISARPHIAFWLASRL
jgi:hypothetical protein